MWNQAITANMGAAERVVVMTAGVVRSGRLLWPDMAIRQG